MNGLETIGEILPFLIPLVVLQLVLLGIALFDLVRRKRVKGGSKLLWGVAIIFFSIIGPVIYLVVGRKED